MAEFSKDTEMKTRGAIRPKHARAAESRKDTEMKTRGAIRAKQVRIAATKRQQTEARAQAKILALTDCGVFDGPSQGVIETRQMIGRVVDCVRDTMARAKQTDTENDDDDFFFDSALIICESITKITMSDGFFEDFDTCMSILKTNGILDLLFAFFVRDEYYAHFDSAMVLARILLVATEVETLIDLGTWLDTPTMLAVSLSRLGLGPNPIPVEVDEVGVVRAPEKAVTISPYTCIVSSLLFIKKVPRDHYEELLAFGSHVFRCVMADWPASPDDWPERAYRVAPWHSVVLTDIILLMRGLLTAAVAEHPVYLDADLARQFCLDYVARAASIGLDCTNEATAFMRLLATQELFEGAAADRDVVAEHVYMTVLAACNDNPRSPNVNLTISHTYEAAYSAALLVQDTEKRVALAGALHHYERAMSSSLARTAAFTAWRERFSDFLSMAPAE